MTTNDEAHQQVIRYMQQTAELLPTGTTLSAELPGSRTARLRALPGPCNDNDSDPEQPYNWTLGMWVLLPPSVAADSAKRQATEAWKQRGYAVDDDGRNTVRARTDDDYVIALQSAATGELSARVTSGCFPKSQLKENMTWPDSMARG